MEAELGHGSTGTIHDEPRAMRQTGRFADLSLHFVVEKGLLLDVARQRLYALNACAAFIWCALKEGKSPPEVGRMLEIQLAIPADAAESYVAEVLRQGEALCHDAQPSKQETVGPGAARPHLEPHAWTSSTRYLPDQSGPDRFEVYSLLTSTFRVQYDSHQLFECIHPLLQNEALARKVVTTHVIELVVSSARGGVAVFAGDDVVGSCRTINEAAVMVRACLTQLAVTRSGGLCAIHAGALCRNGNAMLLPGDAGHGKSTLSAAMAAHGFEMLCDDTALIAGEPPLVHSIPTGLCVKPGACLVLEPHYPRLLSLTEWRRPDGREVRYLMPGEDVRWAEPGAAVAARWIVFPHYRPDANTALLPLPRHEALVRLLRGTYLMAGSLDEQNLKKLIAWIEQIECFELPLSSLAAATSLLSELCN